MDRAITIGPSARYQSQLPAINVVGDAVDGFTIGVAVGALLALYAMTRR